MIFCVQTHNQLHASLMTFSQRAKARNRYCGVKPSLFN